MSKSDKVEKWREIHQNGSQPPEYDKWTDEKEQALLNASRTDLVIGDTALGRLKQKWKRDFTETARKFAQEEWDEMAAAWARDSHLTLPERNNNGKNETD